MKKVMSFLLVMVLCLSLPCAAFASGAESPGGDVPQTGDLSMIGMWLFIMLAALVAIVTVAVIYKRNEKK